MTEFNVASRPGNATDTAATHGNAASPAVDQAIATAKEKAAPYVEKARGFAKARPFAAAALAGVVGLAVLNTLRGK